MPDVVQSMSTIQHVPDDICRHCWFAPASEPVFHWDSLHPHGWLRWLTSISNALGVLVRVRRLLVFFLILAGESSSAAPAKWYLDMENGNPGDYVTAALLNPPGTHGSQTNWSTVSGSDDPTMYSLRIDSRNDQPLYSPLTINGITYTDIGSTRSISSWNDRSNHYAMYMVGPLESEVSSGQREGQPKVSMGCYLRLEGFRGLSYGSYDLASLQGGGQFAVLNLDDGTARAGDIYFRVHTQNGVGERIKVYPEKTYWVTMLSDSTADLYGKAMLRVYDPDTWQLVGNESVLDHAGPDSGRQNIHEVRFGRCDSHGGGSINSETSQYYDDLIVDESGCEWPLMPGESLQGIRICSITRIGSRVDITWMGGRGPYQVQTRDGLSSGNWSDFGTPVAGNSAAVPLGNANAGFIRVVGR